MTSHRIYLYSIATLVLFICARPMMAQDEVIFNQDAEDQFLLGTKQFADSDFKGAYLSFEKVSEQPVRNQRTTAAMIMAAKSLFHLHDYRESIRLLKDFLDTFPQSNYVEDAHYTLAIDYYRLNRYPDAASELLSVLDSDKEKKTFLRAQKIFENVASEFLTTQEIKDLLYFAKSDRSKKLLTLHLAEMEFDQGLYSESMAHAREVLAGKEDPLTTQRARSLMLRLQNGASVKLGIILPLMQKTEGAPREKRLAYEILDGVKYAVDEYNAKNAKQGVTVVIDVRDSEKDPIVAAREIQPWLDNQEFIGIFGPIFSYEVSPVAGIANSSKIPLVTPTATDNGIASVGPYIFQANPDYTTRGKAMAQYAVLKLGYKNLAVVAPSFQPSSAIADSFVQEALRLGALIISDKRYLKGATDLRYLFRAMRNEAAVFGQEESINFKDSVVSYPQIIKRLTDAGVRKQTIDSLAEKQGKVIIQRLFSQNAKAIADSLGIPLIVEPFYIDSLQYPVTSIQGIFSPISSSSEIGIITSQLTYFNIKGQLLGSGEWNNANELDLNKRYAEGVIFSSDRWVENSYDYNQFVAKFFAATQRQPDDNVLFGYDAMSLILTQILNGGTTRERLTDMLSKVSDFPGFHSKISFTEDRVNSYLHILQYKKGKITKIDDIEYKKNILPK
ncbi:MAG TPA: ABC transporter substrate-binding protein [Bacteroidota bacterium]|nr:ABC transporter substrate-binding protein [Bacteroidota bacterium]